MDQYEFPPLSFHTFLLSSFLVHCKDILANHWMDPPQSILKIRIKLAFSNLYSRSKIPLKSLVSPIFYSFHRARGIFTNISRTVFIRYVIPEGALYDRQGFTMWFLFLT